LFKPNLGEVKDALNIISETSDIKHLNEIHRQLFQQLSHKVSLITLSEKGVFYQGENEGNIIPTHIRTIADVSGAGDTVIAVAALVYAASKNISLMAEMANIAGGLVCEEVGTAAINKGRLLSECKMLLK
jgi:bifunctional ADP-heptose synthase (sugar kinase/adenylyltransferase)